MRVLVEATTLDNGHKSGVYQFNTSLLQTAQRISPELTLTFLFIGGKKPVLPDGLEGKVLWLRYIPNKLWRYAVMHNLAPSLARLIDLKKYDLVFCPGFISLPVGKRLPMVALIHDTAFLDVPQYLPTHFAHYLKKVVAQTVERSKAIIAISISTKNSLMKHFGVEADKLTVVNPAVDHTIYQPQPKSAIDAVKKKYNIDGGYLLYLGNIEPRKNVAGLLRAYFNLSAELKNKYQLVLAGGRGWLDDEINQLLAEHKSANITHPGYIDETDKPALYAGAELFVYPSYFEGWGMPVAEAMACGTPVITADNSSLGEVGGTAAAYVCADDVEQLSGTIEKLLKDKTRRDQMAKAGIAHTKQFSWEKSAKQLIEVFERAIKGSK